MARFPQRVLKSLFDISSGGFASPHFKPFADAVKAHDGPLLGLDVGIRHIGVAMSDANRQISFSQFGFRRGDAAEDVERIREVTSGAGVTAAVVGMPMPPPGRDCEKLQMFIRSYAQSVLAECGVQVIGFWDESFTSDFAEEAFVRRTKRSLRKRRGFRKRSIDADAAALILQDALDALKLVK